MSHYLQPGLYLLFILKRDGLSHWSIKTVSVWTGLSSGAFSKYLTVSTYVKGAFYLGDHCHARVEAHFG